MNIYIAGTKLPHKKDRMKEIENVLTGEVKVTKEKTILKAAAIGSCIVITVYDAKEKVAAMAHVMLPGISPENGTTPKTRYAVNAIDEMLERMLLLGSEKNNIEVCLVGGANVLKKEDDTICQANISSVIEILHFQEIKIKARSVGGTERRSMTFDTENGNVYHSIGNGIDKLLWCFIGDNK